MCNLYNLKVGRGDLIAHYGATDAFGGEMAKDYVSPGRPGLVVVSTDQPRELRQMTWGFPPPPGVKSAVVNVRNYRSPFWRSALANPERRCLVPFTSFQEWTATPDPATGKKRPHWFSVPSRPIASFAGVWRPTSNGPTFAFLTTGYSGTDDPEAEKAAAAAHVVGAIHPKAIPVILHDEDHDRWLSAPVEEALTLAVPFPSQLLTVK